MEARDADGYVFRTDLRLRPDPAVDTACRRAARRHHLLREHGAELGTRRHDQGAPGGRRSCLGRRVPGGDPAVRLAARPGFRRRRRHPRHEAADRRSTRAARWPTQLDPVARIAGHNVKLGEGGIREIEFLAQTLQLVWGGRDPALRVPTTLGALRLLVRAGHVPARCRARTGRGIPLPPQRRAPAADGGRPADP